MKKSLKIVLLVMIILLLGTGTVMGGEDNSTFVITATPKSEAFRKWEELPENERYKYFEPIYSETNLQKNVKKSSYAYLLNSPVFEPKYSMLDYINMTVKDQKRTGSCWAFAYTSIMESSMAKQKNIQSSTLLSPMHIDYKTANMYNKNIGEGGSLLMALAYAADGYGPVRESDLPFESVYNEQTNSKQNYYLLDKSQVTLNQTPMARTKEIQLYETETAQEKENVKNKIKEHIMQKGAVMSSLYVDFGITSTGNIVSKEGFYNQDTYAYYCNDKSKEDLINHAVTIVGWDDQYSRYMFSEGKQPSKDGAWIVLNSYGSSFGNNGYFYVSYEDVSILRVAMSCSNIQEYTPEKSIEDEIMYQYDELGMCSILPVPYMANVFTKQTTGQGYDEYLDEVGIELMEPEGIEIYVNSTGNDFSKLTKVASFTGQNELGAGYHTIKLSSPIKIEGEKFTIAVKYISTGELIAPMECNLMASGFSSVSTAYDSSKSNVGESYLSKDGVKWSDLCNVKVGNSLLKGANACIKAITYKEEVSTEEVKVTGITLNQSNISIEQDSTTTIVAIVTPSNATNKNVTWQSSNGNVATISNTGIITAISEGTATITATTEDGGYTATCEVTVTKKINNNEDDNNKDNNDDDKEKGDDTKKEPEKKEEEDESNSKDKKIYLINSEDDTVAKGVLPYTGSCCIILIICIVLGIGIVAYIKFKNLKDIK